MEGALVEGAASPVAAARGSITGATVLGAEAVLVDDLGPATVRNVALAAAGLIPSKAAVVGNFFPHAGRLGNSDAVGNAATAAGAGT